MVGGDGCVRRPRCSLGRTARRHPKLGWPPRFPRSPAAQARAGGPADGAAWEVGGRVAARAGRHAGRGARSAPAAGRAPLRRVDP
eukprot:6739715-Prymnesium_polylepis.1